MITYVRHAEQVDHSGDADIYPNFPAWAFNYDYDVIVCSPYLRCRRTAEILNTRNVPVIIDSRVREYEAHKKSNPQITAETRAYDPIDLDNMMRETRAELAARIEDHLRTIVGEIEALGYASPKILVVTHGVVVKYIYDSRYPGRKSRAERGTLASANVLWMWAKQVPHLTGVSMKYYS